MNLSIIYITSRMEPAIDWFFESLGSQVITGDEIQIIIVDSLKDKRLVDLSASHIEHVLPKPTVWQGTSRLTKENWWAASNSRNTGLCLAKHPWVAFLDDRCVLLPGWLESVREATRDNYAVFGSYQKRTGITVENGVIQHGGIVIGEDSREDYVNKHRNGACPTPCPGEWAYGCTLALPLEWALQVNGYDETCDGLSMEDVIFGMHLQNNGFDLRYDKRMKMIEDRTPAHCGPVMVRKDKGVSPKDKSHALLAMLKDLNGAKHPIHLRTIRADLAQGKPWPEPWGPTVDWWDQQPVGEM